MQEERREAGVLCSLARSGALYEALEEYIEDCRCVSESAVQERRRAAGVSRFPNLAGLCRHIGAGMSELRELRASFPKDYDKLLAIFEDEALNSALSPTLLTAYMKKRLLYAEEESEPADRQIVWCFEHDIIADGE